MNYLKLFLGTAFSSLLLAGCSDSSPARPESVLFNDGWSFFMASDSLPCDSMLINGLTPKYAQRVKLPHTSRLEPVTVTDQWQGVCYYTKRFSLKPSAQAKNIFLKFDGAMNQADVWVNGQLVASHLGGYLPFVADLTSAVDMTKENVVVVRLDNRDNPVTGPKPLNLLDFNTYGGLYRDVHLVVEDDVFITDSNYADVVNGGGVRISASEVSEASAQISISIHIANTSDKQQKVSVVSTITDAKGNKAARLQASEVIAAASERELSMLCQLEQPQLWSPENPHLYNVQTQVFVDGELKDSQLTRTGIRDIKITPQGLWLNGKKRFLRGVNRHQEYPYIGYALSDAAQYRDAVKIKQAGFDYVRLSHYPQSPAFMDACDELGIMTLDAILGWQYFGDSLFEQHALESSRQLIRRDRNHPCVLAWELSINETQMPDSFKSAASQVQREEDPEGYCAGWQKDYDVYVEARQHRHGVDSLHTLIVSEYGDWEYYAQNAGFDQNNWGDLLQGERTSRQPRQSGEARLLQQALNLQQAHNDNLSTHAFADGYWVMFDYNRGYSPDIEYSGIMDIFRLPKFSYDFYRSQRDGAGDGAFSAPMVSIASYCSASSNPLVRVYSNCDSVALYADAREIPLQIAFPQFSGNLKHKPLCYNVGEKMPSTLVAVGYDNGQETCRDTVMAAQSAQRLRLRIDYSGCKARCGVNDVLFVYADVVDANGTVVTDAQAQVSFVCDGDAAFASDSAFVQNFTTAALAGTAPALIRIGDNLADVHISATCQGLTSDQIEVIVE